MALAAYRQCLRSARLAFSGDTHMLSAANTQIRNTFREKSSLDPSDPSIPDALRHAEDVAKILRENVVQGRKTEKDDHTYKLRIHEHTERGDNESIKTAGIGGGCCGGSK